MVIVGGVFCVVLIICFVGGLMIVVVKKDIVNVEREIVNLKDRILGV